MRDALAQLASGHRVRRAGAGAGGRPARRARGPRPLRGALGGDQRVRVVLTRDEQGWRGADRDLSPPATPIPGFEPETPLERRLAEDPVLLEGWAWGTPAQRAPRGQRRSPRGRPAEHHRRVGRDRDPP